MRIGMILDKTFPPDPRVENEAMALIKNKHEVFLFCLKYGNEIENETINEIAVRRFQSNKLEYKLSALAYTFPFYSSLMEKKIATFLTENKIEAIHIHDIRIAEAVFNANSKFKLPVILDLHDNFPEVMKMYPHLQKFPGKQLIDPKKWKIKEEEFIEKSNKVLVVSNEFKEEVLSRAHIDRNKVVLVPNTVRKSFYENAEIDKTIIEQYKEDFVLLYLGDTAIRRGLLTAIESISLLKETIAHIKLVIVGKSTTDPILKKRVNELDLMDCIDFIGWQDVSLFPSFIMASDVCISPLYRNIQHDVAYANKLFQYMSFGKPLLVSDAKAQKNLIGKVKSGLIHKEQNVEDFTEKVIELYHNPDLQQQLGNNGKQFIENEFCWEHVSQNLINLYNNLN